ncbi:MAG TPA: phosphatase PAP2 family protein [Solirubrobacteraceae bacterium]|nr:phosphatase PAP2 family protein [Solirubrobacteraceae bacterium]
MKRSPQHALAGAGVATAALIAIWALVAWLPLARFYDAVTLDGFLTLRGPHTAPVAYAILWLGAPLPLFVLGALVCLLGLRNGGPRSALLVPVVVAGGTASAELLKPLLAHSHATTLSVPPVAAASFPSGHATAAMSLALCAVVVAGPRLRPLITAIGAAFAVATSLALITLGWHFPSDVVGGFLVATSWTLVAVAALWAAQHRWPARTGRAAVVRVSHTLAPSILLGLVGLVVVVAFALTRPEAALAFAQIHTATVAAAVAIAAIGAAIVSGLALALRRN